MAYLNRSELLELNFKFLGDNVKISRLASLYDHEKISIGDNSRVDDFCIISGRVSIGAYVHLTPMCLVAGGELGVTLSDFSTLAYGVKIFSQSDDYSGETLVNSLIPKKYKAEIFAPVLIERHVIIGANSVVFPGVTIGEGCSLGAMSLMAKNSKPWGIYAGIPAKRLKNRSKNLLKLEEEFVREFGNDPI